MAKVKVGNYELTTLGDDFSNKDYKSPTIDPRLVQRLLRGSGGNDNTYISSSGRSKAIKYLEDSKLTPSEYKVKQMLDRGISILEVPVEGKGKGKGGIEENSSTIKLDTTILDVAEDLSATLKADPNLGSMTTGQVLKALQGLIAKGYITAVNR
jgi:hypothetical protein